MDRSILIREIDEATAAWIDQEAERRGLSAEEVVLELLRQCIERSRLPIYHDLDPLAGTWSDQEADAFLRAVSDFERVDGDLWKSEDY